MELPKLSVVCHDAGGAEIVSSWIKNCFKGYCNFTLQGPAIKIFEKKLGDIENINLDESIKKSHWILTGTSWSSSLERDAIEVANLCNKKVVTYLDHWSDYAERFHTDQGESLPDEFWVGDRYAKKIASKIFPSKKILFKKNQYFLDIQKEIKNRGRNQGTYKNFQNILYLTEPIKEHALANYGSEMHFGYTEDTALDFFIKNLHHVTKKSPKIKIRCHPSEIQSKYFDLVASNSFNIQFSKNSDLIDDVCWSDIVVGCSTMGLVVGLLAGKIVISSIPEGGKKSSLPFNNIVYLREKIFSN